MSTVAEPLHSARGLTAAEVADRRARGAVNVVHTAPSRSVREIVLDNVVTRFNLLIGALFVMALAVAPIQDALFGMVVILNTGIGIVQEVRAKRTLDQLALLTSPRVRVMRDGTLTEVAVDAVVLDEVVDVAPGDQVAVDGRVLAARGLELDESLLTGEADPVTKPEGSECLSGSFVVAGHGRMRAIRVGADAYAARLAAEARRFEMTASELRSSIDWLLRLVSWLLVLAIPLLVWSQLETQDTLREALAGAIAGSVAMVPEGLVLLTSVAFAMSVVRLGRRKVLVQQLAAVEGLARVDTVCFDKTGTLTAGRLTVTAVERLRQVDVRPILGALIAADEAPNATLRALAEDAEEPGWEVAASVPFSSARKWSGARFHGAGAYVLGAPEVLLPSDPGLLRRAEEHAAAGRRVLLVGRTDATFDTPAAGAVEPLALVVLGDAVRPDATETLGYFADQQVAVKVISGDHPRTVAAIAERAGVPGADQPVDARDLPQDDSALAGVLERHSVFGRVAPDQKRAMVKAMQGRGHVVAMTGDGVNDVLALKQADIGVAMGSGSDAARAVAQVVLIRGSFADMPPIVAEGRRVIANIERVANLFVTKTVYAMLLVVAVGLAGLAFPFLPRHLTLVGSLTIGIPAFFLALEATRRRYRPGFLGRVLRFALPTGTVAAAATFAAYWLAQTEGADVDGSRSIATLVLGAVGVFALALVSQPWTRLRRWVLGGVTSGLALALLLPVTRDFFALGFPRPVVVLAAIGIVSLTGTAMYGALRTVGWIRHVTLDDLTELGLEARSLGERAVAWARTARQRRRGV